MDKLSCDVIRDLLPSYLDGICSEASEMLVKDHLENCASCRQLAEKMMGTAIVPGQADQKQVDYMKKIRERSGRRNGLAFGLLAAFFLVAATAFVENGGGLLARSSLSLGLLCVGMPVWMVSSYALITADTRPCKRTRGKIGMAALSLALAVYAIFLVLRCVKLVLDGVMPFGLEAREVGPFVVRQLLFCVAVQAVIFIASAAASVRTGNSYNVQMNLSIVGSAICFALISLLGNMSTAEAFTASLWGMLVPILAEAAAFMAILCLIGRRKK